MREPRWWKGIYVMLVAGTFSWVPPSAFALEKPYEHSTWDRFLKKFVNEAGELDYQAVKRDPQLLNSYLNQLARIDLRDFRFDWPREEKLALWLNAYHAGVVSAIVKHYPVKSMQSIPGIWDLTFIKVVSKNFSLNDIRNRQLLAVYRDEKIHMALACGAKSCPKFPREAYTGPRVEGQLFLATRAFVNDPDQNRIIPGEKKIWISRLFKWYAADFRLDFGTSEKIRNLSPEEGAVLSFLAHYLEDPRKIEFLEEGDYKIKYPSFDWSLNEWRPARGKA